MFLSSVNLRPFGEAFERSGMGVERRTNAGSKPVTKPDNNDASMCEKIRAFSTN